MPNADTTLIDRAEEAGVSLATYTETRQAQHRGVRQSDSAQPNTGRSDIEGLVINKIDVLAIQFERAQAWCPVMTSFKGADLDEGLVLLNNVPRTSFVNDINFCSQFSFQRHRAIR